MDLEQKAIERVRTASQMSFALYGSPLVVTDSGGKDSCVCREIVRRAGIPYEVQHNLTTADAPQTIYYVRETFRKLEEQGVPCRVNYPVYKGGRVTMWTLIPMKKFPPTRMQRYCCQVLKEATCRDRFITTGVRWAESVKRKNNRGIYENFTANPEKKIILNNDNDDDRRLFESCALKGKRICNPIVDWTDRDVWDYIRSERLPMNPLYEMGFYWVGCIGCPMAGKNRWREFALFPTYRHAYTKAFGRMLDVIHECGGKHLKGLDYEKKEVQEALDFLDKRIGYLTQEEQDMFSAVLRMEDPGTLGEVINLSYNLDQYEVVPHGTDQGEISRKLLKKDKGIEVPAEIAGFLDHERVSSAYFLRHKGAFSPIGLEKQAISVTVKAFANGLSGKLMSGDIVSVIAPDYKKQGMTVIPAELQYVEVIAVTANSGYDANTREQAEDEDRELPGTVTLLVSPEQSRVLAELEADGKLHLSLVYRGTKENAGKFIEAQDELAIMVYFKEINRADELLAEKRGIIETELPRFVWILIP